MHKIALFALLLSLTNCQKTVEPVALTSTTQTSWANEKLNSDYTIQFPTQYEGPGAVGFEGLVFRKSRKDKQVNFEYSFCGPTFCVEYGSLLPVSAPATVTFKNVVLNQVIAFKHNGQVIGLYYYTNQVKASGVLYLQKDGSFKESLSAAYASSDQAEVVSILQTIQRK